MTSRRATRRIMAIAVALALALALPHSTAWAQEPQHSAPRVSVLNSTALDGLG